ncbi:MULTISPECIES: hypothetical protein [Spirulina sp. CCY15215]|uniref:hypothetical protein n=1 Tax=Spirulina sp. CCY15215 TaxID=2767591 RepID=UPI00194DCDD8|nr:hypothetical protein [Spirulina major]
MQKMRSFLKKIAVIFIIVAVTFFTNTTVAAAYTSYYDVPPGKFTEDVGPQGNEKDVGCDPDTGGTKLFSQDNAEEQLATFYANYGPTDILLAGYLHAAGCYFSHYLYLPVGTVGSTLEATKGAGYVNVYAYAVDGSPYKEANQKGVLVGCNAPTYVNELENLDEQIAQMKVDLDIVTSGTIELLPGADEWALKNLEEQRDKILEEMKKECDF